MPSAFRVLLIYQTQPLRTLSCRNLPNRKSRYLFIQLCPSTKTIFNFEDLAQAQARSPFPSPALRINLNCTVLRVAQNDTFDITSKILFAHLQHQMRSYPSISAISPGVDVKNVMTLSRLPTCFLKRCSADHHSLPGKVLCLPPPFSVEPCQQQGVSCTWLFLNTPP